MSKSTHTESCIDPSYSRISQEVREELLQTLQQRRDGAELGCAQENGGILSLSTRVSVQGWEHLLEMLEQQRGRGEPPPRVLRFGNANTS